MRMTMTEYEEIYNEDWRDFVMEEDEYPDLVGPDCGGSLDERAQKGRKTWYECRHCGEVFSDQEV
jgi:predicted RNA-binding Zn-ribbon protein involved in translation (DUF1610 family)